MRRITAVMSALLPLALAGAAAHADAPTTTTALGARLVLVSQGEKDADLREARAKAHRGDLLRACLGREPSIGERLAASFVCTDLEQNAIRIVDLEGVSGPTVVREIGRFEFGGTPVDATRNDGANLKRRERFATAQIACDETVSLSIDGLVELGFESLDGVDCPVSVRMRGRGEGSLEGVGVVVDKAKLKGKHGQALGLPAPAAPLLAVQP